MRDLPTSRAGDRATGASLEGEGVGLGEDEPAHPRVAFRFPQQEVEDMDVVVVRCAGVDIGKDEVVACVRTPGTGGRGRA